IHQQHDAPTCGRAHIIELDPVAMCPDKAGEAREAIVRQSGHRSHRPVQIETRRPVDGPAHCIDGRTQRLANRRQPDLAGGRTGEPEQQDEDDAHSHKPYAYRDKIYFAWMKRMAPPVSSHRREALVLSSSFEDGILALLPRLRRFAASLSRNLDDGDDLCQMTIERALKARDQWAEGTRLDSWVYRIMRNIWI